MWKKFFFKNLIEFELAERTLPFKADETQFIFKDLTKNVNIYFEVPIHCSEEMNFIGHVSLKGALQSVYGEEREVIWEQETVFMNTPIEQSGDSMTFSGNGEVDLLPINNLLTLGDEEYKLPGSYEYVFIFNIVGELSNGQMTLPINIAPKGIIPLMEPAAKGQIITSEVKTYSQAQTILNKLPYNHQKTVIYYVVAGISLLLAGIIFMLTKEKTKKDVFDRFVQRFIRENSDRMVLMPKSLYLDQGNVLTIQNPEDMVKAADELNQPILCYLQNNQDQRIIELFLFDDVRVYYYSLLGKMNMVPE
ncbi:MAG: DUF5305 domain-containing protein [Vallitaleaceae bacterium]|nr:DUF5305 domain-containing protein [Vallitaleaceae bacterium]